MGCPSPICPSMVRCFGVLIMLLFLPLDCDTSSDLSCVGTRQNCLGLLLRSSRPGAAFLRAAPQQLLPHGSAVAVNDADLSLLRSPSQLQVPSRLLRKVHCIHENLTQDRRYSFALCAKKGSCAVSRKKGPNRERNQDVDLFPSQNPVLSDTEKSLLSERQQFHVHLQQRFYEQLMPLIEPESSGQAELPSPELDEGSIKGIDFAMKQLLPFMQQPTEELQVQRCLLVSVVFSKRCMPCLE